jgi:hypothetical protein
LIAAYHLGRVSGAFALIVAVDRLCARVAEPAIRRTALALVTLGSGVGFLVEGLGNPSIFGVQLQALDLHLPELSGWYSILAIPHFAWATALIVIALLSLLAISERPRWQPIVGGSVALIALTAIHPQMIPVIGIIWFAYQGLLLTWGRRPPLSATLGQAVPFLATTPLLAYSAWILFRDPTIARWAGQWRHQAPDPFSLVLGLGLPLALAIAGTAVCWRRRDQRLALMLLWPPLVAALLYLPNLANIQRRLLDALYLPIGILAAVGLQALVQRMRAGRARRIKALALGLCCLSSLVVLAIALRFASGAFSEAYITDDAWQAMQWLSVHHQSGDRALSAPGPGQLLPAWSGVQVYVGHYSETVDYFQKIARLSAILEPSTSDGELGTFLSANGITLLYWGPDEAKTGFSPEMYSTLHLIYVDGTVRIYRVERLG